MKWKGMHVLVTGAGGFIGSHLIEELVKLGADVTAFIHYNSSGSKGWLDRIPQEIQSQIRFYTGDLKDQDAVRSAVRNQEVVMHLGALIAIPYSYQNPTDVFQTNVLGTLHVAQAVREYGISRMVHTSTSEVYGSAQMVPIPESHPLQGQSPYSASKIGADKCVESFYCSFDLPVATVRPFNAYGPRQSMRAVIPTIINQALHRDEIVLGNLEATRDFTYVKDTARAFIHAATSEQAIGTTVNAGSGREIRIGDLATYITQIIGRDLPIRVANERLRPPKSEVDRLCSDSSKALNMMGWEPQVSLREGLERTVEWISSNPEGYRPDQYVV
ncbi:SDR family NAD(P)-dependent oxidoreductase [Thermoactinomyces sp. DSM 45892]|uniref:SDR family NAD(P)-dependent oxidoreductase n=1 Tax=Thermoactinomyces sp. DSM 45892 TaxID=1882753 RepID=UPI0008968AD1|nr:SDR family NAD(P)-dependent oxidoreductase [Thermoactinomyces sp. DSM 45892]SDZ04600.1 dTDP-glucose 4,6-dehydratase [Thermoactinomyces sp. DSM 45892]